MNKRPLDKIAYDAFGLVKRIYGKDAYLTVSGNRVQIKIGKLATLRTIQVQQTSSVINVYQRLGLL
jgi:hypothetical protein